MNFDHFFIYLQVAIIFIVFMAFTYVVFFRGKSIVNRQERNTMFQQTHLQDDSDIVKYVDKQVTDGKGVSKEMAVIKAALARDSEYAWSWYCNLVMSFVDAGCEKTTAMRGAARFLSIFANIDICRDPRFTEEYSRLKQDKIQIEIDSCDLTRPGPLL